jgi:hypothetical protein
MSDTVESLRKQLADAEENRRLIQERKAEYVQATDIPLQLVKDERRLDEQIAELRDRLAGLAQAELDADVKQRPLIKKPPRAKARLSGRTVLLALLGLVGAVAVVVWMVSAYSRRPELPTPEPVCQRSATPVRVAVAQLPGCPTGFQTRLVGSWVDEAEVISLDKPLRTRAEARAQTGFDIVVWSLCQRQETGAVTLDFELTSSRKPDEVYEPPQLSVTGSLTDAVSAGLALASYQHGDYPVAASRLIELPTTRTSPEQALLWANSLLFAERYGEAIKAYEETVLTLRPDWSAAYNNLGVARFNQDLGQGETGFLQAGLYEFGQAIELASAQGEAELELLARVNRSDLFRRAERWSDAQTDCQEAWGLHAQSALPYVCRALYDISYGAGSKEGIPFDDVKRNLDQAEASEDVPAKLYYLRASWYREQNRHQEATDAYGQFLDRMRYRACLQTDAGYIDDARYFLDKLGR